MTLPMNGTLKRIIACVVGGVILFMAGAVLGNSNRITATENQIEAICANQTELRRTMETNRGEFREDFDKLRVGQEDLRKELSSKLDLIAREVKK